ncbi:MAG: long-chain fatty acid--CoA ligase [Candidatus Omnitrophica bacterium]|nr:long-chain fatty acid--CoA ligase [Candidatus Omnitrophota bacterium]
MPDTIPALFFEQAARYGRRTLAWAKRDGRYQPITWEQTREAVRALSMFLLHVPVNRGDRVVILSENLPEWGVADLAIQSIGAWTVPIYPSLTEGDLLTILRDCESVACIASTHEQAQKLRAIRSQIPSIRRLILLEGPASGSPEELSWGDALRQGGELTPRLQELFEHRLAQLRPDDTMTLIYTSGTTGEPKGVMLSHRNFLSNAASCLKVIPIHADDLHLSFLPLSHVFERMAGWYLMLQAGASVAYAESMDTIPHNMLEVHPTIMLGVPRFFEKLYGRIQEGLAAAPPHKQRLARWAMAVGQRAGRARLAHQPMPPGLRLSYAVANRLAFKKLQQRLGGRLRFFVSGSAPLSKTIGEFFYSIGVTILEGYGLTETSPVIAVNRPEALKFGSVGQPIEGVDVRIAEDGEILTRGPHVMQGYYRKPEATRAAITDDWFQTGDIGHVDEAGFLFITDRKKDLIKTAGGKFVAPQKLENLFVTDPYVAQAFVCGDRRPYCVALIVPQLARLRDYAASQGIAAASPQELTQHPAVQAFMWSRIEALQQGLPNFERVKRIALLDQEFTQAAGELTPTMKAKRAAIISRYEEVLAHLYQGSDPTGGVDKSGRV